MSTSDITSDKYIIEWIQQVQESFRLRSTSTSDSASTSTKCERLNKCKYIIEWINKYNKCKYIIDQTQEAQAHQIVHQHQQA
ncbi:hypothetical protein SKB0068_02440 [Staphylococcus hominis subsp. novobiosepticus]